MTSSLVFGQDINKNKPKNTTKITDKTSDKSDLKTTQVNINDLIKVKDSTKKDSTKTKKPLLEAKVIYKAIDYAKINQKKKEITLFNKAELYYTDVELKSGIIVLNYDKSEVYAGRIKDSTGNYSQYPNFKQGASVVEPDSIRFNFKSKKALVWNSRTEQGEIKVKAAISKRENDSVYFMKGAHFTTAKDIEDPEYEFVTNRLKFVPGKKVVTGSTVMKIAGVPTPLVLPFAFFPMGKETRLSGIIFPNFADNAARGYSLQNGGYYFNLSDYYDLAVLGDYFTNGGFALRGESSYALRYKFRGNFRMSFENQINGERGFSGYSKSNIYNINWSHSRDSKSNPNSTFSASVNLGSSQFFQQSLNQTNTGSRLNNTLSSSVSYSKRFNTVPQVNVSLSATHQQNSVTQEISMTLPTLQLNVDRIFPFAPIDGEKKGFIKNINLQYTMNGRNEFRTNDADFFTPKMFENAKVGMEHSIPLSTNFKIFRYLSATSTASFKEVWYLKTIRKNFDENSNKVVTNDVKGFDAYRTYSFSTGLGTTIYGTFKFGDNKKIQAIRHIIKPNISYSYTPSFERYFDSYAIDATGLRREDYNRFESGIFGGPSKSFSNIMSFDVNNTFEAKVRDQDSTKVEPKKVMLLNNLSMRSSYNMDTKIFDPVQVSGSTQFFNSKMNVNFSATLDPYAIDINGTKLQTFNSNNGGSLFRLTSANMNVGYSLSSQDNKDKKENKTGEQNGGRNDDLFGANPDLNNNRVSMFKDDDENPKEESEFFKTKINWDLTFAYSLTYNNIRRENTFGSNTLMVSGNIDLTPKWKIGASSGYDLVLRGVTYTNFRIERDLLSWRMNFNWIPFGTYTSWGFFIGIKSSVLSDIKWEKNKIPDRSLR